MKYGPTANLTQTCPPNVIIITKDETPHLIWKWVVSSQLSSKQTLNVLASYAGKIVFLEFEISYWEISRSFIKEHRVPLQPRPFVCSEFSYQRCQNVDFWQLLNCLAWFQKCSIFVMSRIILKLPRGMISWWWQPFSATFQTHVHHSQG